MAITAGPDGALWFTQQIGRITTDGVITNEFTFGADEIAAGPDGALWLTEPGPPRGMIVRMGVDGVIKNQYDVSASPTGITVGPDGAIWFTEVFNILPKIGRIDPTSGTVSEYPSNGGTPIEIAAGSDGALWFSEWSNGGDKIGRITTSGVITNEYSLLPYGLDHPDGIALGPDGAMWFTASSIGRSVTA